MHFHLALEIQASGQVKEHICVLLTGAQMTVYRQWIRIMRRTAVKYIPHRYAWAKRWISGKLCQCFFAKGIA